MLVALVSVTWLLVGAFVLALCRASARAERKGAASRSVPARDAPTRMHEALQGLDGDSPTWNAVQGSAEASPVSPRAGTARGHRTPGVLAPETWPQDLERSVERARRQHEPSRRSRLLGAEIGARTVQPAAARRCHARVSDALVL